jgi:hypothetical protein
MVASPGETPLQQLQKLAKLQAGKDGAEQPLVETNGGFCKGFQGMSAEEEHQFCAAFVSILTGPSAEAAHGAVKLVAALISAETTQSKRYYMGDRFTWFISPLLELLRTKLTAEHASAVLSALDHFVVSVPPMAKSFLRSENFAHTARWLSGPSTAAAGSLIRAVVTAYMKNCKGEPLLGCSPANVSLWIQSLQAGVVDAACLGMAIHALAAREEDLTAFAERLSSGSPSPMELLAMAAMSWPDAEGRQSRTGSQAAMLVMHHFAGFPIMDMPFCLNCSIRCCITIMMDGDDVMALLAAHTFSKWVLALEDGADGFLRRRQCRLALITVLGRGCPRCKHAGALAMALLVRHVGEDVVIPWLFLPCVEEWEEAPEEDPTGEALAQALISAVAAEFGIKDRSTKEEHPPLNWQSAKYTVDSPALRILLDAAKVEPGARLLASAGVGSMLRLLMKKSQHYQVTLLKGYLHLLHNTSALPAKQREDLLALGNPGWLLELLKSKQFRVEAAALYVFAELASEGLVLDSGKQWDTMLQVLNILKRGDEDLFKPAALALAGLLRGQKSVPQFLMNNKRVNARLASTLAARKVGREQDVRAAGAIALEALLRADPAWAELVLKEKPAERVPRNLNVYIFSETDYDSDTEDWVGADTEGTVARDLVEMLGHAGSGVLTVFEQVYVRACLDVFPGLPKATPVLTHLAL